LQSTVQQLKAEKADAENQTATQAKKLAEYEKQIANQSAKISQMERKAKSASPFLGFVVSWSTQDHDIDLVVTDPSGKSFDYKRRSYPGHPGKFILDTRRGPGAEMWESHRLLPGLYKISYVFYNTYGNKQPATVLGSVYSAAGIFDLPKTQLNFDSKREQDFKIQVSEDGVVKVLP
jgi:uncharacterized protein YfaP (DUF2135 family)